MAVIKKIKLNDNIYDIATSWEHVDNIDDAVNQDCFYIYTTGTNYNKQIYFLICVGDNVEGSGGVRTQYRCNATPGSWERTIQYRSQRYSNSKNSWINDKDEVGAWTDWTSISNSSGGATIDAYTKAEIDTQRATIFNTIDETAIQSLIKQYDLLVLENNEQFNTYGTQELIDYIEAEPKEDTDYTESNVPDGLNGHYEVPLGFEITIPEGGKTITIFDTVIKQSWIDNIENNENKWANITIDQDNQNKYYITNLIPNRLYTYTIKNSNGKIIDTGKCKAKDSIRFIDAGKVVPYNLADPTIINTTTRQYYNIRDLGGWSCDGGHKLKYGVIYRGCELSGTYTFGTSPDTKYGFQLPDYQKSLFKDFLKIKDEIDLRQNSFILGTSYTETAGDDGDYDTVDDIDESAIGAGISYGHFPGIGYKLNEDVIVTVDGEQVTYNSRIHYINAIKRIAQDIQNNKPIYIHCSAGADRTGTLCMLIEALCGVSKTDLDKDYELTSYSKNFKSQQNTRKRLSSDWKNLLSYIKNNYEPYSESFRDQVIAFLIQSGVTIDEINIIRGGLIDGTVDNIKHPYAKTDIVVNLTNASIDNDITKIEKYSPFKAKISVKDGYVLNQLSITMSSSGHTSDITNSVYSNGIINIPKVIGVVHITGTAISNIPETYTKSEVDALINSGASPQYVIDESESVLAKAFAHKGLGRTIRFIAVSDSHNDATKASHDYTRVSNLHCGQAVKYIADRIPLDFVASLGDMTWAGVAHTTAQYQTDWLKADIQEMNMFLKDGFSGVPNIRVVGNHDQCATTDSGGTVSRLQNSGAYQYFGRYNAGANDGLSNYGYYDIDNVKLRIIYLNTSDTVSTTSQGTLLNVSQEQKNWLCETLIDVNSKTDAANWKILLLSHAPLDMVSGIAADILIPYTNGGTYGSYTFTNHSVKIIGNCHGHTHCYRVDYMADKIRRFTIPNSNFYDNNHYKDNANYSAWNEDTTYPKTANSRTDTSFSLVTVDLDSLTCYVDNYGAGYDREFSLDYKSAPAPVNLFDKNDADVVLRARFNSSHVPASWDASQLITGFIEVTAGDTFTVSGDNTQNLNVYTGVAQLYNSNKEYIGIYSSPVQDPTHQKWVWAADYLSGSLDTSVAPNNGTNSGAAYIRFCLAYTNIDNLVITK